MSLDTSEIQDDGEEEQHDGQGHKQPKIWRQHPVAVFLDDLLIRCSVEVVEHLGETFVMADLIATLADRYLFRLRNETRHPRSEAVREYLSYTPRLLECTPFKSMAEWAVFESASVNLGLASKTKHPLHLSGLYLHSQQYNLQLLRWLPIMKTNQTHKLNTIKIKNKISLVPAPLTMKQLLKIFLQRAYLLRIHFKIALKLPSSSSHPLCPQMRL